MWDITWFFWLFVKNSFQILIIISVLSKSALLGTVQLGLAQCSNALNIICFNWCFATGAWERQFCGCRSVDIQTSFI